VFFERVTDLPVVGRITHATVEKVLTIAVLGVELFFVLSGYLIGGILIRAFEKAPEFTFGEVKRFWIRRWFRTLPIYWLIFTVNMILYHVLKISLFEVSQLKGYVFLQNLWYPNMLSAMPEGWSLAVEEWFYLTLPVTMYLMAMIFKPRDK